ncbi:hypothetical protein [Streptomyces sp. NPDC001930]|uniref:hypothetical protein n=1 Tax=Streptomyces sp. NPDC001930 TaxID=3364625 RepID=UPI0036809A86
MLSTSVALTVAFVLGSLGTASPASAWGSDAATGQPGQAVLPQIQVSDVGTSAADERLTFHGVAVPRVFRSPATPAADPQNVVAFYDLERWNGSQWAVVSHERFDGQILPFQDEISFPMVWIQPTTDQGSYRITFGFSWSPSGNPDRVLAEQRWVSSTTDDLSCGGTLRACEARSGSVAVGPLAR